MKEYLLFGAIDLGTGIIERTIEFLENLGGKVLCFIDDDPKKQDRNDYPRPVFSSSKIREYPNAEIVILSSNVKRISQMLQRDYANNARYVFPMLGWGFPCDSEKNIWGTDRWIDVYKRKCEEIYDLSDKETKYIFDKICFQRSMKDIELLQPSDMYDLQMRPYFYEEELKPNGTVTLVDCGAYDGDSVWQIYKEFKGRMKLCYALEPDKDNFERLKENIGGIDCGTLVRPLPYAASDENTVEYWSGQGVDSKISSEGNIEVDVRKLDSIISDIEGTLIIKMDIEGSEKKGLLGAKMLIKDYSPYMAICVYHKVEDLYEIPYTIQRINHNYRFVLRSGTHTECYAIPTQGVLS